MRETLNLSTDVISSTNIMDGGIIFFFFIVFCWSKLPKLLKKIIKKKTNLFGVKKNTGGSKIAGFNNLGKKTSTFFVENCIMIGKCYECVHWPEVSPTPGSGYFGGWSKNGHLTNIKDFLECWNVFLLFSKPWLLNK